MTRLRAPSELRGPLPLVGPLLLIGLLGSAWIGANAAPASLPAASGCTAGSGLSLLASPSAGTAPLLVSFTVSDPRGTPASVNWSFGDGQNFSGPGNAYLSPTHLYSGFGTFEATVNISVGSGFAVCSVEVDVSPSPLVLHIEATPSSGVVPLTVHFTAIVSGGSGTFASAIWTFGDGNSATGFNVSETYANAGRYPAVLTVVDSVGQTIRANTTIRANATQEPGNISGNSPADPTPMLLGASVAIVLVTVVLIFGWRSRVRSRAEAERASGESSVGTDPPPSGSGDTLASPGAERNRPAGPIAAEIPSDPIRFQPSATLSPGNDPALGELEGIPLEPAQLLEAAVRDSVERRTGEPEDGPRLKLSQRVLLHLFTQGQLADGEVAPMSFTQGGMAERLQVGQSPLSSVLRRLVVAGLVSQDTRHVRGQPRRLRVYRLTPLGESVSRDLYHRQIPGRQYPSEADR